MTVQLDLMRDYPSDQDSRTLAHAFYPRGEHDYQPFWGDSLRTIYAQTCDAIKRKLGRFDLRLLCLVLEDEELTRKVLEHDPYLVQARVLTEPGRGNENETGKNIQMTIHSRIAEMKVLAAHLERARCENVSSPFSLRDFIEQPRMGVLSVSCDATYRLVQDPMNGVLFWRLIQMLDAEQNDSRRKIFLVLDEFPILAGDEPCPGIHDLFTRLRSRGVTVLITYQAHATLKRVYGEATANIVGLCGNIIYTRQADVESAEYASKDLGWVRGWEQRCNWQHGGPNGSTLTTSDHWAERAIFDWTELQALPTARREHGGVFGIARTPELLGNGDDDGDGEGDGNGKLIPWEVPGISKAYPKSRPPWHFNYAAAEIDKIPRRSSSIPEYVKLDPRFENDAAEYFERIKETQRIEPLSDAERHALLGEAVPRVREATPEDLLR